MDITEYLSDILLATARDDVVFEEADIKYAEALRAGTLLKQVTHKVKKPAGGGSDNTAAVVEGNGSDGATEEVDEVVEGKLAPAAKGDTVVAVLIDRRLVLGEAGRVMRAHDFTVGTEYSMVVVRTGVTLNKAKLVYSDKSAITESDVEVLKKLGIVVI